MGVLSRNLSGAHLRLWFGERGMEITRDLGEGGV
jgi:hypothetical protein